MDERKAVGIWPRVSTEDQAKGESPEHHERRARLYAEAKGWEEKEVYRLEAVSCMGGQILYVLWPLTWEPGKGMGCLAQVLVSKPEVKQETPSPGSSNSCLGTKPVSYKTELRRRREDIRARCSGPQKLDSFLAVLRE